MIVNNLKKINTIDEIVQSLEDIVNYAQNIGFTGKDLILIKLAMEEACVNAFKYCKKIKQPEFDLGWVNKKDEYLEIFINRKGEKYNFEKKDERIFGENGRGLQIISGIMDQVELNEKNGNVSLRMIKNIKKRINLEGAIS